MKIKGKVWGNQGESGGKLGYLGESFGGNRIFALALPITATAQYKAEKGQKAGEKWAKWRKNWHPFTII